MSNVGVGMGVGVGVGVGVDNKERVDLHQFNEDSNVCPKTDLTMQPDKLTWHAPKGCQSFPPL